LCESGGFSQESHSGRGARTVFWSTRYVGLGREGERIVIGDPLVGRSVVDAQRYLVEAEWRGQAIVFRRVE
jgi:hypothetical protein